MSTEPLGAPRPLPQRPHLRHLKDQAKDLLKAGAAASLADAQSRLPASTGFLVGLASRRTSNHWQRSVS